MTCAVNGDKCGREKSFLCRTHADEIVVQLRELPWLDSELHTTAYGQARIGDGDGGRRSASRPLPFRVDAGALSHSVRGMVDHWFRFVYDSRFAGRVAGPRCATCTHDSCALVWALETYATADMARWLATQISLVRFRSAAGEFFTDIDSASVRILRMINRPPERWYAGRCDSCAADMYATPGAPQVRCFVCGEIYNAEERRAFLIQSAQDRLATPATISAALTSLGDPVEVNRIEVWASRGQLISRGREAPMLSYDSAGRRRTREVSLYRVGDVIDLLNQAKQAKLRRKPRRVREGV